MKVDTFIDYFIESDILPEIRRCETEAEAVGIILAAWPFAVIHPWCDHVGNARWEVRRAAYKSQEAAESAVVSRREYCNGVMEEVERPVAEIVRVVRFEQAKEPAETT